MIPITIKTAAVWPKLETLTYALSLSITTPRYQSTFSMPLIFVNEISLDSPFISYWVNSLCKGVLVPKISDVFFKFNLALGWLNT